MICRIFRDELKESTQDSLYETYRTEKLLKLGENAQTSA